MYQKNGTSQFLAKHATPDLMQYIHTLARKQDSSQLEKQHRNELASHAEAVVEAKKKKQRKKENQALEKAREIEKVPWVENDSKVGDMTVPAIKMQLEKYRSWVEDIPKKLELNKMKKPGLVTLFKTVIAQHIAAQAGQPIHHPIMHTLQPAAELETLYITDLSVIDGLTVPQLKTQLEMYRACTNDLPKKSDINKLKKAALVDLLKRLMVQYQSSKTINQDSNLQDPVQAGGQMIVDETPRRMEDLAKIKSSKTNKTVLKTQLELYRQLVSGIPTSDQLEGKKKTELVELLVEAVNQYRAQ